MDFLRLLNIWNEALSSRKSIEKHRAVVSPSIRISHRIILFLLSPESIVCERTAACLAKR